MHRTEGANNVANLFTEGPPATTVTEEWLNAVQEEIIYVIESAGISLKTAATETRTQLREALLGTVPMPRGYIDGLIMSNNVADNNHDIDIAVGKCRGSGDTSSILFTTAMTKQIDANWAEGTNAGGFPTGLGAVAADTWYHVFVIMSADGSKVDAGFDTSLIATNLLADATDYSIYRRIGSVFTGKAGAADIWGFVQKGDDFIWNDPQQDFTEAMGVVSQNQIIRVPLGVSVMASFNYIVTGGEGIVYFRHPDTIDIAPAFNAVPYPNRATASMSVAGQRVHTNTNSQMAYRAHANNTILFSTIYYVDPRGKNA